MRYYPLNLDVRGFPCVVVGGGGVGTQKVRQLLRAGARVRVVSPEVAPPLARLARAGRLEIVRRRYRPGDLAGMRLAFGATNDPATNARILAEARRRGVLLNAVDDPDHCDFTVPSMIARGGLLVTISTGGASPALSKRIRRELERNLGPEYGAFVRLLGRVRRAHRRLPPDPRGNQRRLKRLVASNALDLLKRGDRKGLDRLLGRLLGPDVRSLLS